MAFNGPADDCIIDKIDEFAAELSNPATDPTFGTPDKDYEGQFVGQLPEPPGAGSAT